jgi:hypothetical protein
MGINYKQYCLVGKAYHLSDLEVVDSEEITEKQPRYDSKTGKVKSYETVIVKEEESHYELLGASVEEPYEFEEFFRKKGLSVVTDDEFLYVGHLLGEYKDFGRADLLEGSVELNELSSIVTKVEAILESGCYIIFCSSVG